MMLAGRRYLCRRTTATATATMVNVFWQPQHSQKTEIEKEKEKKIEQDQKILTKHRTPRPVLALCPARVVGGGRIRSEFRI